MQLQEMRRSLDAALSGQSERISVTFTDLSPVETQMSDFLDAAIGAAAESGKPLSEIQLCMEDLPSFGARYWHVQVTDSGETGVLRLIYEGQRLAA